MTGRNTILLSFLGLAVAQAGTVRFQPRFTGSGNLSEGRCTIRVMIDDQAEVALAGDTISIWALSGQDGRNDGSECTGPLPRNVSDFRFRGVDGRGEVRLQQDPRSNRGVAVVYIRDSKGGEEGYTFELSWQGGSGGYSSGGGGYYPNTRPGSDGYYDNRDAAQSCEREVRQEIRNRYNQRQIDFENGPTLDTRGQRDVLVGWATAGRGGVRERYSFECRVNRNGRVRNVVVRPENLSGNYPQSNSGGILPPLSGSGTSTWTEATRACEYAIRSEVRGRYGLDSARILNTTRDDRPGRNDRVMGTVEANRGNDYRQFNFECRVDFSTGRVRNVQLSQR